MVSRTSREKKERQLSLFFSSSFTRSVLKGDMRCMPSGDIFAHAKLFFPIATGRHWSLVVANMQTLRGGPGSGSLEYFDSSPDLVPPPQVIL